jgi:hypothetical protein
LVKPSKTASPGRLLTQVAGERRTGALIVGNHPGGTVYLVEGNVTYAESPAAPGAGELLTASGRLAGRTWQAALDAGTPRARVGRLLVEHGHLTQGELELCVLGAVYDAAFFALFPTSAPVDFADGVMHWLGPVVRVDPAAVNREARRRARLLDEIFPDARVDTAPVIPVTRPPVERITLTTLQWELLVHADGQRTPADLAQLLGRAGYATIQELRRLAGRGLLELPPSPDPTTDNPDFVRLHRARGTAVDIHRPTVTVDNGPTVPMVTGPRAGSPMAGSAAGGAAPATGDPPRHSLQPDPATANGTAFRPPRLARRKPGARLPKDVPPEGPPIHPGTDEVLLKRLRTALRALR